jgi:hypothetical protein
LVHRFRARIDAAFDLKRAAAGHANRAGVSASGGSREMN